MCDTTSVFTVYYDGQFWVGVYERSDDDGYTVCKITFGPRPSDTEVYEFLLGNYNRLQFSKVMAAARPYVTTHKNPKRTQREAKSAIGDEGVGTKAQQVLKAQHEQNKEESKVLNHKRRDEFSERKFELRRLKRMEKHKGR
jgi:hypothetical protein